MPLSDLTITEPTALEYGAKVYRLDSARWRLTQIQSDTIMSTAPPCSATVEASPDASGTRLPPPQEKERRPEGVAPAPVGVIEIADVAKLQLRTAKVIAAEVVAGANKLLKLQIEIGEEKRQIVAGIAQHYKPEDVIGKTIIVVANLKPAVIRGVESNGMLLAASKGDVMRVITVEGELPSGATVK